MTSEIGAWPHFYSLKKKNDFWKKWGQAPISTFFKIGQ
jgi:hypothetical protein